MIKISTGLANLLMNAGGKSFTDAMRNGVIRIFSGEQPASADDAETGTLLCEISKNGVHFVASSPAGGLNFESSGEGSVSKPGNELWQGRSVANGSCGWFRHYDNNLTTGASSISVRYDGAVGILGSGELKLSHLDTEIGNLIQIKAYAIIQPRL